MIVSIDKFGNTLKWFGPLTLQPVNGQTILHKIRASMTEP